MSVAVPVKTSSGSDDPHGPAHRGTASAVLRRQPPPAVAARPGPRAGPRALRAPARARPGARARCRTARRRDRRCHSEVATMSRLEHRSDGDASPRASASAAPSGGRPADVEPEPHHHRAAPPSACRPGTDGLGQDPPELALPDHEVVGPLELGHDARRRARTPPRRPGPPPPCTGGARRRRARAQEHRHEQVGPRGRLPAAPSRPRPALW